MQYPRNSAFGWKKLGIHFRSSSIVIDAGKSKIPNGKGKKRVDRPRNMGKNKECKKCTKNREREREREREESREATETLGNNGEAGREPVAVCI
jgi:hypothetical protein